MITQNIFNLYKLQISAMSVWDRHKYKAKKTILSKTFYLLFEKYEDIPCHYATSADAVEDSLKVKMKNANYSKIIKPCEKSIASEFWDMWCDNFFF